MGEEGGERHYNDRHHEHTLTLLLSQKMMSCELATYLLRLVPENWISHELLWTSGEIKLEGEAKDSIHVPQEI